MFTLLLKETTKNVTLFFIYLFSHYSVLEKHCILLFNFYTLFEINDYIVVPRYMAFHIV